MFFAINIQLSASTAWTQSTALVRLPELPDSKGYQFWDVVFNYRQLASTGQAKTGGFLDNPKLMTGNTGGPVSFDDRRILAQPFPSFRPATAFAYDRTTIESARVYREDPYTGSDLTFSVNHIEALITDIVYVGFRLYFDLVDVTAQEEIRFLY